MASQSLADVIRRGVTLTPADAVAVVQQLISSYNAEFETSPPFGPPTIDTVHLRADGAVFCRACASTPAVSELARLIEAMLPAGVKMPGALRYAVARAFLDVDAPPFGSLHEFSAALSRIEPPNCVEVVRGLYQRAAEAAVPTHDEHAAPALAQRPNDGVDRRRPAVSPAELRRHLRQADAALFASQSRGPHWALGGAMAALIAFGAGYAAMGVLPHATRPRPAQTAPTSQRRLAPDPVRPVPAAPAREDVTASAITPAAPVGTVDRQAPLLDEHPRHPQHPQPLEPTNRRAPARRAPSLVRAVDRATGPAFSPSFASNGSALFFHSGRSTDAHSALEAAPLADPDLGVMTIVDDGAKNYHVQPSPDGARVAFDSDRDGERGVYVAYRDGSGVRRVSGAGYAAVPTWSPDGRRLAFIRAETDRPRVWNLWLLDLASGDSRRLTSFRYGQTWSASWFADGRRICYTHEDRLIVANLDTGATKEFGSPVAHALVRTPAVSPDDRHVIFQVARRGAWMIDLADGSMRQVLADPTAEEFAWSPDGRRVAFHSRRDGQWSIWLLDRLTS
jgi:Tol biopolymer transport system component